MDRFTKKQQEIDHRADEVIADYPALWSQMITDWHQPGSEDRAWLMYSANYLFRTSNVRWAMDPLHLKHRLPDAPEMPADDLKDLDFILLTHQHSDHLDLNLLYQLKDFPILWVIPEFVLELVRDEIEIPANRLIVPEPMRTIEIRGIRICPFNGLHWEQGLGSKSLKGVPAMGYLVEFNGKRWLFPGDTRTYDASQLPSFGPIDGIFAHLWLGRGCALMDDPLMLNIFCQFCVNLQPKRIALTHLQEFGRDPNEYWDKRHSENAQLLIKKDRTDIGTMCLVLGDGILL